MEKTTDLPQVTDKKMLTKMFQKEMIFALHPLVAGMSLVHPCCFSERTLSLSH
jgi:hypothetical protein